MNTSKTRSNTFGRGYTYGVYVLLACLYCGPARAGQDTPADTAGTVINTDCTDLFPEYNAPQPVAGPFSFMDTPQQSISSGLEGMVQSIDSFFANEHVLYESSGSYVRYSLGTLFEEGGHTTTLGKLDISLRLPRTEKKLNFIVESNPAEQQSAIERASKVPETEATTTDNYFAGVQGEFGKQSRWQFKPSLGVRLRSPIEYYLRLRLFRNISFRKWSVNLSESAYWYDTTGAGFDSEMEWNRPLSETLLFRSSSLVRNTEQYHRFDLSQFFSLTQTLSDRRAMTWSIGVIGHSDPSLHATDYLLQLRYRQIIQGDYLFMELVPQIHHGIDNGFKQEVSLLLRLEWLFRK